MLRPVVACAQEQRVHSLDDRAIGKVEVAVGDFDDFHTGAAVDTGGVPEQVPATRDVLGCRQIHGVGGEPVAESERPEGGLHEQVHHVVDETIGSLAEDELEEG